jgi:L-lactate dehydrogenase
METYCRECNSCTVENFKRETFDNVKNAAYEIIDRKGATYYAVALAVRRIVEAIVRNENSILTVSSLLEGEYGLKDICLSVPSQVNSEGISRIINVPLSSEEKSQLDNSAQALKQVINGLAL